MRVKIDSDLCQGHNRCVAIAPKVFDTNDDGLAVVALDPLPADQQELAQRAKQACPERAISLTDD